MVVGVFLGSGGVTVLQPPHERINIDAFVVRYCRDKQREREELVI